MTKLCLALAALLFPTLAMAVEPSGQPPKKTQKSSVTLPKDNPCAQYGPGFIQVAGTTTCIKVGASVTYESGGKR